MRNTFLILGLWVLSFVPSFSIAAQAHHDCMESSLGKRPVGERKNPVVRIDTSRVRILRPLTVQIDSLEGFPEFMKEKVHRAAEILESILDSQGFYEAIHNHTYNQRHSFANNVRMLLKGQSQALTNIEIYKLIQMGQEIGTESPDRKMNLRLKMVSNLAKNTVAQTYLFSSPIEVSRSMYQRFSPERIAANIMHEWLHNMGFSHRELSPQDRQKSVPYAVGNIVLELAQRYR